MLRNFCDAQALFLEDTNPQVSATYHALANAMEKIEAASLRYFLQPNE